MNVIEALNSRVSIRAFKPDLLSQDMVRKILEAATHAPSWANAQPWEMYVAAGEPLERIRQGCIASFQKGVPRNPDFPLPQKWPAHLQKRMEDTNAARLQSMGIAREDRAARQALILLNYELYRAPVVVFIAIERTLTPWSFLDVGLLMQSIMLAAQEYGVDSMPAVSLVTYPDFVRAELAVPANLMILMGVALGYRDPGHAINRFKSARQPFPEVARFKGFPEKRS